MVKKSENLEKFQKISKFTFFNCFFLEFNPNPPPKKKKLLSSQFSNIRRMRFDQSSPVQPVSEIQKSGKISKSQFKKKETKKIPEKNAILLVFQYQEDTIRPELSSPPRFRIQGGQPERDTAAAGVAGRFFSFLFRM